ncbi:hypothetical protein [Actinocrispum wychmicini]|uniref:Uncharacterized protein n=1 Tax=Actinocrispum wychmicini TaxID=1213861 RepID=A0A4R2JFZ6_9PSEU|nr:hypothetical protein [Actinocrispum wychmicini]TCO57182.1 hypothetical protein EV192_106659 [Actinocrispum wychmicini]
MTYEKVAVTVKATGPDALSHVPVEVAWWNLATGDRGQFVPPHDPRLALASCDLETVEVIGYFPRLVNARQDTDGREAIRLAEALHGAVLVTTTPHADEHLLRRMYLHYLQDFERHQTMTMPQWDHVLDIGAYAAGVLGLSVVPDLDAICQATGTPLEAAQTAETDTDALGRAIVRLLELAAAAEHRHSIPLPVPARPLPVPAPEHLSAALALRLDRLAYDLVTFHYNEVTDDEAPTYSVNTALIGQQAVDVFGPIIRGLIGEVDRTNNQLRELVQSATGATTQWQARLDRIRATPPDPELHKRFSDALWSAAGADVSSDLADHLAQAAVAAVGPMLAAKDSVIGEQQQRLEQLDRELDKAHAARQSSAVEVRDPALSADTPWAELVIPPTELSVGPDTREPATLDQREVVVVGPITPEDIVAMARLVSPLKGGCPNTPGCGHPGSVHDIEDDGDPIPMCCAREGDTDCPCGQPPAGWQRAKPERYWQPGETVPAGAVAYGNNSGIVVYDDVDWINPADGIPLVEVVTATSPAASDNADTDRGTVQVDNDHLAADRTHGEVEVAG